MTEDSPDADRTDGADETTTDDADATDGERLEGLLRSGDVIELTADGADVRLTDAFERALLNRVEQLRGGDRALRWFAASEGVDPEAATVVDEDDRFVVSHDGDPLGAWHSEAGFLAAIAVEPTVRAWLDEGRLDGLPEAPREELAARLLGCLETCPACEGALSFVDHEGHAGGVALTCADCGAVVATVPTPHVDAE